MDDLEMLRAFGGPDPVPNPDTEARARTALLARAENRAGEQAGGASRPMAPAARRRRWGRLGWRIAVPAVAAAVAVGALAVVENVGVAQDPGPAGPVHRTQPVLPGLPVAAPANAAEALRYAADAAAREPFTMPRPDQWLYLETKLTSGTGPGGGVTGGPLSTHESKAWHRIDGAETVWERDGKLVPGTLKPALRDVGRTYPYAEIAALPADPAAVLAWVRGKVGGVGGGSRDGEDQIAFVTINGVLRENLLPPAVEAAFYRALGRLSGVTLVPGAVNLDGRPAIAVARVQEGWLREEILLDPRTYRLIGERAVAIADHTNEALDGSWRIRKGTVQRYLVRSAAAIVDRPGQVS
jgi:hypothetical protein